jgi:hypothetical protein
MCKPSTSPPMDSLAVGIPQHPDEHCSEGSVLLAIPLGPTSQSTSGAANRRVIVELARRPHVVYAERDRRPCHGFRFPLALASARRYEHAPLVGRP